jgi:hypothetical protein
MQRLSTSFPPLGDVAAPIHADGIILAWAKDKRRHSGDSTYLPRPDI